MKLTKFFKRNNNLKRQVYAVEHGSLLGYFLTVIDFDEVGKKYLVLGCKMDNISSKALEIPEKDMKLGIEKKLLTYVETLGRNIFRDCKREYLLVKSTK